jgi:hypothetical protein
MRLTADSQQLVAQAVTVMESLPQLCSPAGSVAILPTIVYLTIGVLHECSTKPLNDPSILATSLPVAASLKALKTIASDVYCKDDRCKTDWCRILLSGLAKIIDLAKTGSEETKVDEVSMMLAMTMFILHAPHIVVCSSHIRYPCINEFTNYINSEILQVRVKCVQTLRSIFQHPDKSVSSAYILALAPRIIEYLHSDESRNIATDMELQYTLECIYTVEALVKLCDPKHRVEMLVLVVPALMNFLLESCRMRSAGQLARNLHDISLNKLIQIGPEYPTEFRALMNGAPELRNKLESAIKANQEASKAKSDVSSTSQPQPQQYNPTIKLTMDFSKFSSK